MAFKVVRGNPRRFAVSLTTPPVSLKTRRMYSRSTSSSVPLLATLVDPSLADVLVQDVLSKKGAKVRRTRPANILSERELQVLRLVARGYSSQQIANQILVGVMLDVGANRDSLLKDPMYIGNRHARVRGKRYDAFMDAYVKTATKRFPHAMLQWADFEPGNGRRILEKYPDLYLLRRYARRRRHHARCRDFRSARARIATGKSTRGRLWRRNGGHGYRRS